MHRFSLLACLGLALLSAADATTTAATSVVSLLIPAVDSTQLLVGSVVAAAPTATTYSVGCPPGTDSTDCGLPDGATVVQGPNVYSAHFQQSTFFIADVTCSLPNSDTAVCTMALTSALDESARATAAATAATAETTTEVETLTGLKQYFVGVTVTAGLEKIAAATASPTASRNAGVRQGQNGGAAAVVLAGGAVAAAAMML